MKLWSKNIDVNKAVEVFTIGKDRELDLYLAKYDVLGSLAHTQMLTKIGLLEEEDFKILKKEFINILDSIEEGQFIIEEGIEDVHSQVEFLLTNRCGDIGKKIHSGRSRNDQVLLDLKLFFRDELGQIVNLSKYLFEVLISLSEKNKEILLPGYTHLQAAMPSSFGLWFGAYAEGLSDDLTLLEAAYQVVNQNPLGSAAGYGNSFPLDREMTTRLLGFKSLNVNSVYAQMGRGKVERTMAFAMGSVAATLSKFAMDVCLYANQDFQFIKLADEFTTGSSIMPHKKNPDVFELIRAKCNKVQGVYSEIQLVTNNLPSGYFRDMQIVKEIIFPAIFDLKQCLEICTLAVQNIEVNKEIIYKEKYKYVFSVEEVNKLVLQGVPFRDAYKTVSSKIEDGSFEPDLNVKHEHIGSVGNLRNDLITRKFNEGLQKFPFEEVNEALSNLVKE